jgi:hypothetical protein
MISSNDMNNDISEKENINDDDNIQKNINSFQRIKAEL